jgi:LacI family transcriptional regulator
MVKSKNSTPPGHVNLRMLAEHLELSQTTVSLVLNNSPSAKSIPEETRKRVIEAAERLNYRPNYFARSLRQSLNERGRAGARPERGLLHPRDERGGCRN